MKSRKGRRRTIFLITNVRWSNVRSMWQYVESRIRTYWLNFHKDTTWKIPLNKPNSVWSKTPSHEYGKNWSHIPHRISYGLSPKQLVVSLCLIRLILQIFASERIRLENEGYKFTFLNVETWKRAVTVNIFTD